MNKKINLLFITQRLDYDDPDLGFVPTWVDEFIRQGINVQVVCLKKGRFDDHFPVFSLGKEKGLPKWKWVLNFYKLIFTLKYNQIFVHMNPEWSALAGWYWRLTGRPFYLWYTHYTMNTYLRLTGWLAKKMFCATKQSLPQYNNSKKKIVTGHGIDLNFWQPKDLLPLSERPVNKILMVHRLSRSKRVELSIKALKYLPDDFSLTIYGRTVPGEEAYLEELKTLVDELKYQDRVEFMGSVPMPELKKVYSQYRLMLNMASETIDKTKLEALYHGCWPITTAGNSQAIGMPIWPEDDQSQTLAKFILDKKWEKYSIEDMQGFVRDNHSLPALIKELISYF